MSRLQRPYRTPLRPPTRSPVQSLRSHAQPHTAQTSATHSIGLLLILVATFVVALGSLYAYQRVFGALNKISSAQEVRVQPTPVAGEGTLSPLLQKPFTTLVIGTDVREDPDAEGIRSDTLIVVYVDPVEQWASMLSIPRDTMVDIPTDRCPTQKINAAYACGYSNPSLYPDVKNPRDSGAALAADTVEDYLNITIDYTVQVDFNGFQQLVDALGGITVDVPRAILDPEYPTEDHGFMRLYYPAGLQRMDGVQALRYARTRHVDNDFGRAQRQQQVIQAGLNELKRRNILELIDTAPKLLDALSESVRTTMPINNITTLQGLAQLGQNISANRVKRLVLQPETNPDGSNTLLGDYNNLEWDPAYVRRMVDELYTPPDRPAVAADGQTITVQVQNGTRQQGLATQVSNFLADRGFETEAPVDAPAGSVPHTLILDYTGNEAIAQQLAQLLSVDPQNIRREADESLPTNIDIVVRLGQDYQPNVDADEAAQN